MSERIATLTGTQSELAALQAALVSALVAGTEPPPGFNPVRLRMTREALLRKRTAEVAVAWPYLAASLGTRWDSEFGHWARHRPPAGALRDGWDFARAQHGLSDLARDELVVREARLRYDGPEPPRRRRVPAVRRGGTILVIQVAGRMWQIPWRQQH